MPKARTPLRAAHRKERLETAPRHGWHRHPLVSFSNSIDEGQCGCWHSATIGYSRWPERRGPEPSAPACGSQNPAISKSDRMAPPMSTLTSQTEPTTPSLPAPRGININAALPARKTPESGNRQRPGFGPTTRCRRLTRARPTSTGRQTLPGPLYPEELGTKPRSAPRSTRSAAKIHFNIGHYLLLIPAWIVNY